MSDAIQFEMSGCGGVTAPSASLTNSGKEENAMADVGIPAGMDGDKPIRVPVSQRVRFEVFKRDKFTCQYCGRAAPEVVLNCDHMTPVSGGGSSDILNLVTSCKDCNGGKGAIPLTDNVVMGKQFAVLAELEERRQQLDMMMWWRDELQDFANDEAFRIAAQINQLGSPLAVGDTGMTTIRKWLKRFTFNEIVRAADTSFEIYLFREGGKVNENSWEIAFGKIPGVVGIHRQEKEKPYLKRLFYIQGIIRNRLKWRRLDRVDYLEHLHVCGASLDEMERRAARIRDLSDFEDTYDAWLNQIGKPF